MTPEHYHQRRAELLRDFYFQQSRHLKLKARARIRAIAKLDFAYDGTPIEQTKTLFHYDSLL
ncbi:MAG: hypothetical protein IJ588_13795 [Prevotella sp.]|nr:hypothetical protein [Prevotella sp.]